MHVQTHAQAPQAKPIPKVSCVAENHPESVVNAKTGKSESRDNWVASCTIKQGDGVIWQERLTLPYPAKKREAYDAIDEFMDKKAPQIILKSNQTKEEKPK
jgi:hypothetical protein